MREVLLGSLLRQADVSVLRHRSGGRAHFGAAPSSAITGAISTGSKSGLVASGSGCETTKHRQELSHLKLVSACALHHFMLLWRPLQSVLLVTLISLEGM